ncbi:basal cell adhesion molecule isoform X2 [Chanos chanos]|uniref:Basal cell adhesion molecule isoform X2 n=1 Tax=Chanos chanos TaxID=29144 RepID=A0A6J2W5I5_CHACN|nr:basal cell adhesion molecule isoform X2 [Chanos chanos]
MERTTTLGRFACLCTLLLVSLQVSQASVNVAVTPEVEVIKGMTVTLPCKVTAPEPNKLFVEWYIEIAATRKRIAFSSGGTSRAEDGTPLTGRATMGDDMSLIISSVRADDERSFFCQASGVVGSSEAKTQLKVFFAPEKPIIKSNDRGILIDTEGDSPAPSEVGQCVSRNGHPQPRIIWYNNSVPLPEVQKDTNEKTFMLPSVQKEPSGLFTVTSTLFMRPTKADKNTVLHCTVEYRMPNGKILQNNSDTLKLNLLYPTEHVTFSVVNTEPIKEGDDVMLKCETDGNPQPEFDFSKDGESLTGAIGGNLTVRKVTRADAGQYNCEALDFDAGPDVKLTQSVDVTVHYLDPVMIEPQQSVQVKTGEAVEMQCKTKSSDDYTLQWKKDSKVLSQAGSLQLESVTLADAGVYHCVGMVPSVPGLTKEANITVVVSGKPEIETPANGEVVKEGDMVSLTCSAMGYPAPQFTWKPSGEQSVTFEGNKIHSRVTLKATAEVLKDGVTCEAANEHGADLQKFQVNLKETTDNNDVDRGRHLSVLLFLFSSFSGLCLVHIL